MINEENITELDMGNYEKDMVMVNDENDAEVFTSSIYLNDQVKNLIEELVVEQIRHKEKQILCFNELMKIWYGENFISAPTKLDIQKESGNFDDCKKYIFETIARYLPDGESELYSAYHSLKRDGKCAIYHAGISTIYSKEDLDIQLFYDFIHNLNKKLDRQYKILRHNFIVYLQEMMEDDEMNNKVVEVPFYEKLRLKSQRKTINKVDSLKPFLNFKTQKRKPKKTINDFLKAKPATKKAKVI